jgi:hypothetical protein
LVQVKSQGFLAKAVSKYLFYEYTNK